MMKKVLSLLIAAARLLACMSALAEGSAITDGYYTYFIADMNNVSFIHFNEDGTYYAKYLNGVSLDAGTYEVVDRAVEYYEDADGDGNADIDGGAILTSEQAVILHSFLSSEEQVIAFVDDALMDMDLGGGLAHHRNMTHKPDYRYNPMVDEDPITIAEFYANGSTGDAIYFGHDGTFTDGTGDMLRFGTWKVVSADEYELTFDDEDETGTIQFNAAHTAATMTVGDEVTELVADVFAATEGTDETENENIALYFLNAAFQVEHAQYGTLNYEMAGEMLPDGTVTLNLMAYGNSSVLDQGTWTVDDNGKTFHFVFEKADELDSEVSADTAETIVHYAVDSEESGALDCQLVLTANPDAPAAVEADPVQLYALEGEFTVEHPQYGTLDYQLHGVLYDNQTVVLILAAYGSESELDRGTWVLAENGYTVTFNFDNAGEIQSELDTVRMVATLHYVFPGSEQAGDIDAIMTIE